MPTMNNDKHQNADSALSTAAGSNQVDAECPECHCTCVNDEWVYVCQCCGMETCPDCAGRCGCKIDDED